MRRLFKPMVIVGVIYARFVTTVNAENPAPPERQLTFELSDERQIWEGRFREAKVVPTHAAVLRFEKDVTDIYSLCCGNPAQRKLRELKENRSLSGKQQEFLGQMSERAAWGAILIGEWRQMASPRARGRYSRRPGQLRAKPSGPPAPKIDNRVVLYAVSEEDTRKMAKAFVEYLDADPILRLERSKNALAVCQKAIVDLPKEIAELKEKITQTDSRRKTFETYVRYFEIDKVRADKTELGSKLRSIEIDIKGVQAKMDATKRVPSRTIVNDIKATLDLMVIELDIELAGLLARKQATERYHNNADQWIRLYEESRRYARDIHNKEKALKAVKKNPPGLKMELAEAQAADMAPVKIVDNKVVIHLLEPPPEESPKRGARRGRYGTDFGFEF